MFYHPSDFTAEFTPTTAKTPVIQYQNFIIEPLGSTFVKFSWTELSEYKLKFSTPCQGWKLQTLPISHIITHPTMQLWVQLTPTTTKTPIIQYQSLIIEPLGSLYVKFQVIWTTISRLKLHFSTPCQNWSSTVESQPLQRLKTGIILTVIPCHLLYLFPNPQY